MINYLINKRLTKNKGRKVGGVVYNLKTAFDSVNRNVLLETMRVQGVREGLVDRVEQVVQETKIRVRIGVGGKFLDGMRSEAGMSAKPDSV